MRLRDLERDKDVLLDHYAGLLPEALDGLAPEERNHVFLTLRAMLLDSLHRVDRYPRRISVARV